MRERGISSASQLSLIHISVAISSRILSGDEEALRGYRAFLKGGCSMTPIDLLKLCGVDMSTTKPVEEALKVFGGLVDEFAGL